MSLEHYRTLVEELCLSAKIDTPAYLVPRGCLNFNGTHLMIEYIEEMEILRSTIGLAPFSPTHHEHLYRTLLSCDYYSVSPWQPTFACHPETGDIVMVFQIGLNTLQSGEELVYMLLRQVDFATTLFSELTESQATDMAPVPAGNPNIMLA
jgi:hypothetical protein